MFVDEPSIVLLCKKLIGKGEDHMDDFLILQNFQGEGALKDLYAHDKALYEDAS